jgi:[protein-PII] uridylyltransferase
VHQTFLEILNHRGNVGAILRTMHETGLLGRYLPEFGKMTCLVQHEFFHRYTADEHTLVCLEMLDEVWAGTSAPFKRYTSLLQKIEHPSLLNLALLLHDSGKALPSRKHADQSVRLCHRAIKRMGLDSQAAQTLIILVENHLALIQISQQRDLEDPAVAKRFANLMKTPENLDLLLLHTFADSMGTSSNIWNDFKEALVWTLYDQAMAALVGGPKIVKAAEKQREALLQEVRHLMPKHFTDEELQAHFKLLPPRYFQIHSAPEVLIDLVLAHDFYQLQTHEGSHALEPVIMWNNVPDRGYSAIRVCTWDRAGLFSKIAGSLTSSNLNILSAHIFSRADGIIFDTFYVTDAQGAALPSRKERESFESMLKDCLTARSDINTVMSRHHVNRTAYAYLEGEKIPIAIQFDNAASDTHTIIDIQAEDRFGLLFAISKTLSDLKLDIATAKISTEKGAAVDSFYVRDADGQKVSKPERIKAIETKLRSVISKLL